MVAIMAWRMHDQEWRKGPWTPAEDDLLIEYVRMHGEGRWSCVAGCSGLKRSGKSCRLRWVNYLRPGLKKGQLTPQEEGIIIELHALWGNKWSTIARYLPGRTDNEIKNYWRTNFKKKGTPSQNQEKEKHITTFRQHQYHQHHYQQQEQQTMNNYMLPHIEENNRGVIFESPEAKMEENTISEDDLWSGILWNYDNDQYPNDQSVIQQSFSSYF